MEQKEVKELTFIELVDIMDKKMEDSIRNLELQED